MLMRTHARFLVSTAALWLTATGLPISPRALAQRLAERPAQRVTLDLDSRPRSVAILVPGTSVGYILPGRPPPSALPDLPNWTLPDATAQPRRARSARNAGDAFADAGRSFLGERDIDLRVYAKGAEKTWTDSEAPNAVIPWYGADSRHERAVASAELSRRIDQIPPHIPVVLVCYSHGCTVGTAAANSSQRGVDGILSLAHPGWVQPDPRKVKSALNFYRSGDLVRQFAGDNDGQGAPARSPGKITEVTPLYRNFILDEPTPSEPRLPRPIGDHLAITDPALIDALITPTLRSWLAQEPALARSRQAEPAGDVLIRVGRDYNKHPSTAPGVTGPASASPFAFQDQALNSLTGPVVPSAPIGALKRERSESAVGRAPKDVQKSEPAGSPPIAPVEANPAASEPSPAITLNVDISDIEKAAENCRAAATEAYTKEEKRIDNLVRQNRIKLSEAGRLRRENGESYALEMGSCEATRKWEIQWRSREAVVNAGGLPFKSSPDGPVTSLGGEITVNLIKSEGKPNR